MAFITKREVNELAKKKKKVSDVKDRSRSDNRGIGGLSLP